jgi:hypothetical protein
MPVTISGTAGITYPAGGLTNTAGAGVGTTDTQTLTNKTLTSPSLTTATLTTPNIDSAQIPTVSGTAPLYMCRAWVNFNGTGTVAIRASGNVTSITDNGTGDYTVNFTTAMSDANYSAVFGGKYSIGQANQGYGITSQLAASCRFTAGTPSNNTAQDFDTVCVSIFR